MRATEPKWCDAWTSQDDVTGEGERTFYHECSQPVGHSGNHTCMGDRDEWDEWQECHHEWSQP